MNIYLYAVLNCLTLGLLNNIRWTPEVLKVPSVVEDRIRRGVARGWYVYTDCRDCSLHKQCIVPLSIGCYVALVICYLTLGIPTLVLTIAKGYDNVYGGAEDIADRLINMMLEKNSPIRLPIKGV